MALNEIYKHSDWISLPVPEGRESGQAVAVGELSGVLQTNRGEGGNAEGSASVALTGAFELESTVAFAVGAPVYVAANGTVSATDTGTLLGHAIEASAGGADATVIVRLAGHGS